MTLRDRCKRFLLSVMYDAEHKSDAYDRLTEFVVAEIGRAQHSSLEDSLPLCLYFQTEDDRDEFMQAMALAKPNMTIRKV